MSARFPLRLQGEIGIALLLHIFPGSNTRQEKLEREMPRQALLCVAILSATACAAEAGAAGHQLPTTGWTPSPGSPALLRLRGGGYSLG